MSMPVPVLQNRLDTNLPAKIDLDKYEQKQEVPVTRPMVQKQPTKDDMVRAIITECPEEEKDSNFGDYGTESESESSSME